MSTLTQTSAPAAPAHLLERGARDFAYLSAGLLTSFLAFVAWIVAVTVSLTLAPFVVGLPVILGMAWLMRAVADADRVLVAIVCGARVRGRYATDRPRAGGWTFRTRLSATLRDTQTWKDLSWLVVHSLQGFVFGVLAVTLAVTTLGIAVLPAWYWALPDPGMEMGLFAVDTLPLAFCVALLAVPLGAVTLGLLRLMTVVHSRIARALLV